MPDFSFENAVSGIVAGIDEAGRGPLAGPVVAAAAIIDRDTIPVGVLHRIDDSKKLSRTARRDVLAALEPHAAIAVATAEVKEIDRVNILEATLLAMRRAVDALASSLASPLAMALVDGNRLPDLPCPAQTVIGGDARSLSIAAASIAAKVRRDTLMAALAKEWPGYGWERNAGYGTAEHKRALADLGLTPHHRRSFAPVAALANS